MPDRLEEMKARHKERVRIEGPLYIHEDIDWLIAEVEQLRAQLSKRDPVTDQIDKTLGASRERGDG